MLELDELGHELRVEALLLFGELTLGPRALGGLPLFDPRDLGFALLLERGDHRVDPEAEPAALILHPSLDTLGSLLDGALELLAGGGPERIPCLNGRCGGFDGAHL